MTLAMSFSFEVLSVRTLPTCASHTHSYDSSAVALDPAGGDRGLHCTMHNRLHWPAACSLGFKTISAEAAAQSRSHEAQGRVGTPASGQHCHPGGCVSPSGQALHVSREVRDPDLYVEYPDFQILAIYSNT